MIRKNRQIRSLQEVRARKMVRPLNRQDVISAIEVAYETVYGSPTTVVRLPKYNPGEIEVSSDSEVHICTGKYSVAVQLDRLAKTDCVRSYLSVDEERFSWESFSEDELVTDLVDALEITKGLHD